MDDIILLVIMSMFKILLYTHRLPVFLTDRAIGFALFSKSFRNLLRLSMTAHIIMLAPIATAGINTSHDSLVGRYVRGILVTASDAAIVEPACVLVLTNGAEQKMWYEVVLGSPLLDLPQYNMAKNAVSLHHYCYAEIARNKYFMVSDKKKKSELVEIMLSDYKFMVTETKYLPKDWRYLSLIFVKYGDALLFSGKEAEAVHAYQQALKHDVGYDKAHVAMASFFARKGNRVQALAQVTEGLRYKPDSKGLKRLYAEYGGKLPYPTPYSMPGVTSNEVTKPRDGIISAPPFVNDSPEAKLLQNSSSVDNASEMADYTHNNRPAQDKNAANGGVVERKSIQRPDNGVVDGSSKPKNNPYCRFCP